jgi:hypothetical protein
MATQEQIRITRGELEAVQYAINGILGEIQSDSIDMGYIAEKLKTIENTARRVRKAQTDADFDAEDYGSITASCYENYE